jgi:hypothetical protein
MNGNPPPYKPIPIEDALKNLFGVDSYIAMRAAKISIPKIAEMAARELFVYSNKGDHHIHHSIRDYLKHIDQNASVA